MTTSLAAPGLCSEVADGVTQNNVSLFREPDAVTPPVRFDEREQETESSQTGLRRVQRKPSPTATGRLKPLRLFSTLPNRPETVVSRCMEYRSRRAFICCSALPRVSFPHGRSTHVASGEASSHDGRESLRDVTLLVRHQFSCHSRRKYEGGWYALKRESTVAVGNGSWEAPV